LRHEAHSGWIFFISNLSPGWAKLSNVDGACYIQEKMTEQAAMYW
jgi:hypothetical protein